MSFAARSPRVSATRDKQDVVEHRVYSFTSGLRAITTVLLLRRVLLLSCGALVAATQQTAPSSFQDGLSRTHGAVGRARSPALQTGGVTVLTGMARALMKGTGADGQRKWRDCILRQRATKHSLYYKYDFLYLIILLFIMNCKSNIPNETGSLYDAIASQPNRLHLHVSLNLVPGKINY